MNFLIVGRGWVGKFVYRELVIRGHNALISSHEHALDVLSTEQFDWVVNCAGVTGSPNVDACEAIKTDTIEGNAIYPVLLYEACKKYNVRMSHFSSGCIYSGNILDVNAEPNYFGSIYSISKGISDSYLKDKVQLYRIRMPFTGILEPRNYLTKVLKYAKYGKLVDFGQNSLSYLNEAVKVSCDLMIDGASMGPYNLVNSGSINMHELVELLGISTEWFTEEEFKAATVAGRSTCTIPAYEKMSPVRDALKQVISKLNMESI